MADPRSASILVTPCEQKRGTGFISARQTETNPICWQRASIKRCRDQPWADDGASLELQTSKAAGKAFFFFFLLPSRPPRLPGSFSSPLQFERQHLSRRVTAESQTAIMCGASIKVNSLFTKPGRQQSMAPRRSESPSQRRAPPDIPPSSRPPG